MVGRLGRGQSAVVKIRSRMWADTFLQVSVMARTGLLKFCLRMSLKIPCHSCFDLGHRRVRILNNDQPSLVFLCVSFKGDVTLS